MVTTAHLGAIRARAAAVGAKIIPTGDDRQLGAVGAGGLFKLITEEVKPVCLEEVRRFDHAWEREASLRLRGLVRSRPWPNTTAGAASKRAAAPR